MSSSPPDFRDSPAVSAAASVIAALRRFLPDFLREHPVLDRARRRAIWALSHCRTVLMGGHVQACEKCGETHFAFHSCNHRSCPQCGALDTAEWVEREFAKRVGAVTDFTVTFSWKDRRNGDARRRETLSGVEFTRRYLRHVLPHGLRAIRRYGFCHPAAKLTRERIAFHTGLPLLLGTEEPADSQEKPARVCSKCAEPLVPIQHIVARWFANRPNGENRANRANRGPPRTAP